MKDVGKVLSSNMNTALSHTGGTISTTTTSTHTTTKHGKTVPLHKSRPQNGTRTKTDTDLEQALYLSELEAAKAASIADDDDYWSGTSGDDCSYIDGIENTQGSNHNHYQHYCDSGRTVGNNTSNNNNNSNQTDYDLQRALLLSGLEVKTQNGMLSWEEEQQLQYDTYAAQRQQQQKQQQQQKNYTDSNSNSVKTNDKSGSNPYSSFDTTLAQQQQQQQRQPEHLHEQQPPDLINETSEEENRDDVDYYPTIPSNHHHQSDFNQTANNTVMTMPTSMPAATSTPSSMTALLARKRRSSSSMIVSFDTLKIFYHEDFDSLLKSGRVKINTIPTYQGRIPDSVSF